MALKRYVHSVVLGQDGVREDVDAWVAAGGKGVSFADVEIDRAGRMRKRWGIASFTTNALTPPSPLTASLTYGRRLNSVQGELVSYTGKALYGYSETAVKWAHRGEFGSVMSELMGAIREAGNTVRAGDVCVKNGYVVAGYVKQRTGAADPLATVFDESGNVYVQEARVTTGTDACPSGSGIRMLGCGASTVGMVWGETGGALKYSYVSTANWGAWTTATLDATGRLNVFDAVSMGASGFAYAFYETPGSNIRLRTADESGTQIDTVTIAYTTGAPRGIALHWDGTYLHVAYYDSAAGLLYKKYNSSLVLQTSGTIKATIASTANFYKVGITYNTATSRAFVVWQESAASASLTGSDSILTKWREIDAGTGVVAGAEGGLHAHWACSRPVYENGQYHFLVSSDLFANITSSGYPAIKDPDGDGTNHGAGTAQDGIFMVRLEPELLSSASAAPVVVSAFALGEGFGADITYQQCAPSLAAGSVSGTHFSLMALAVANLDASDAGRRQMNLYKHTRDARGAGKMLACQGGALVLGGVPSFYDGVSAYNLATLVKPTILQLDGVNGSGSLTASGVYGLKLVQQWVDAKGNVVLSQPSDAVSVTLGVGDDTINASYRTSPLENKRNAWPLLSAAFGQSLVLFYRTENGGTTYLYEKQLQLNRYATDWGLSTLEATDAAIRGQAEPYVYGGELANTPLPSCHVGCVSSGRAHLRSDEDKRRLYYSKPLVPSRTVEFDTLASYNMFPEEIINVADLGGIPCAVSKRHVYVVDGLGPGLAGLPAGAFTVREVAAIGTEDQESVIAVPGGVLFRGPDGFYLVGAGGIEPVGDRVQDAADAYGTTICADLDPETRSARFLTTTGSNTRVLVYYWDTKQWVVHTPDMSGGALASMVAHKGHIYFGNDNGSYGRADGTVFSDEGGYYAGVVKLGWEHVEGVQTRKRFWEVDLLMRRKAAHAVEVKLWYGRDESDADTFYFTEADITTIGTLEKIRVQIPHGRGTTDAIQVQVRDVRLVTREVGDPYYDAGSGQGFELVAVDYVIGIKSGPVKLAAVRTA